MVSILDPEYPPLFPSSYTRYNIVNQVKSQSVHAQSTQPDNNSPFSPGSSSPKSISTANISPPTFLRCIQGDHHLTSSTPTMTSPHRIVDLVDHPSHLSSSPRHQTPSATRRNRFFCLGWSMPPVTARTRLVVRKLPTFSQDTPWTPRCSTTAVTAWSPSCRLRSRATLRAARSSLLLVRIPTCRRPMAGPASTSPRPSAKIDASLHSSAKFR